MTLAFQSTRRHVTCLISSDQEPILPSAETTSESSEQMRRIPFSAVLSSMLVYGCIFTLKPMAYLPLGQALPAPMRPRRLCEEGLTSTGGCPPVYGWEAAEAGEADAEAVATTATTKSVSIVRGRDWPASTASAMCVVSSIGS